MATVLMTAEAAGQVEDLPLPIRLRVAAIVKRLEKWPAISGAKPLKGALAGHYRVRTGDYRVQFYLKSDTIVIEKVGQRGGFYEE